MKTRMGTVDLAIPKLRQGTYFPTFLEPRRRSQRAFMNVVTESYVLGVSTRKVDERVNALLAQGISKSVESRMASELDAQLETFRNRPLQRSYPYAFMDALYIKVRDGARVAGIFPNAASVLRLVGMNLVEQNDEWATSRRYFSLQSMGLLKPAPVMTLEAVS